MSTRVPESNGGPRSTRRAPGPGLLEVARIFAGARNPFVFLDRCVARYGDLYSLPLGPNGTTVVNHPDHVGSWLSDYSRYHKGVMSRSLVPALGESTPVADGEPWRRNRKALNPAFGRRNLDGLASIISASLQDSMDRWGRLADSGEEVDMYRELSIMAMAALQRSMFSSSVDDDEVPELVDLFRRQTIYMGGLMMTFWIPSRLRVPVPGARRGVPAVAAIRRRIEVAIAHRRARPTDAPDVLNLLLDARDEDTGEPLDEVNLVDQLMGVWFGGFDTTASALVWTLALLAQHPEQAERLRDEADAYQGDFASYAELEAVPYARAAFDEAQRLQGALLLTRQALEDDEIGGYFIAEGSQVGVERVHAEPPSRRLGRPRALRPRALARRAPGAPAPVPVGPVRRRSPPLHRCRHGLPRGAVRADDVRETLSPRGATGLRSAPRLPPERGDQGRAPCSDRSPFAPRFRDTRGVPVAGACRMKRIIIDADLCQGTKECAEIAGSAIRFDDVGIASVADDETFSDDVADRMVATCPSMAIATLDDDRDPESADGV